MNAILELLERKNQFLSEFFDLNEREIVQFQQSNFDQLDYFYQARESLLEIIHHIDQKIDELQVALGEYSPTDDEKVSLKKSLTTKDNFVHKILSQDLVILQCIDDEKSAIIRELQEVQKNKKGISAYKSPTFHKTLDEEV